MRLIQLLMVRVVTVALVGIAISWDVPATADNEYWAGSFSRPGIAPAVNAVDALAFYDGSLIVAGNFAQTATGEIRYIARWDGSSWHPLGSGVDGVVHTLAVYDGALVVGGNFTHAGGTPAQHLAVWDGSHWDSLGSGVNDDVECLTVYGNKLVAGGGHSRKLGA